MVFLHASGTVRFTGIAYGISAIVLLPINSALNPILYSDVFDKLYGRFRQKITTSKMWTSSAHSVPNNRDKSLSNAIADAKL